MRWVPAWAFMVAATVTTFLAVEGHTLRAEYFERKLPTALPSQWVWRAPAHRLDHNFLRKDALTAVVQTDTQTPPEQRFALTFN